MFARFAFITGAVALPQHHLGWMHQTRALRDDKITLTFALRQTNLVELEELVMNVSDPSNQQYGQHLTRDEVDRLVAPTPSDIHTIMGWVSTFEGEIQKSGNGDFIMLTTTVQEAEHMLGGHYHEYRHPISGASALRMDRTPVLANDIAAALDFVSPTTQVLPRKLPMQTPSGVGDTSFANTPNTLRKLYSIGNVEASHPKNRQAVTGFLEQHRTNVDLQAFFTAYYKKGMGRKISQTKGDGADETHTGGQIEAELDTQYSMAIGGNVNTEFWTFKGRVPGEPENEPFLKFITTLANTSDAEVPLVVSTSYGEDEDNTDISYAKRCNVEFQKAAARGISLLFSSGDSGVAGIGGDILNDTSACKTDCDAGADCFVPQWPAASPWVTSVGGTKKWPSRPESAEGISSGGFSLRWTRPSWQKEAVETYLKITDSDMPDATRYRSAGRGFPDISAQSVNFMVILDAIPYPVSGTSCSSPTVAGIVSLLNDLRLQEGNSPLGFLNPLIYSKFTGALNDITSGSNPGCDTKGFPAKKGWDAVTGLGTPDYAKMAQIVKELPAGQKHKVVV
jgi:tripeptidyl-peptidase-1